MKKSSIAMKSNIHISNKMVKKFPFFLTTTRFVYFRTKEMTENCKNYLKTSYFTTGNKRVVIILTTINKSFPFYLKNGSCKSCARRKTGFSIELDKIIHHTIFGDLNIV